MIQIKKTVGRDLDRLCKEHYLQLSTAIVPRLNLLTSRQATFINDNLEQILSALPAQLIILDKAFLDHCTSPGRGKMKSPYNNLKKVINYDAFAKKTSTGYCGYVLAGELKFNTCPYCNRNYNVTVEKNGHRIVRPDFDHFFPRSKFPLLALSFYNLIPCCTICNRTVKTTTVLKYNKSIHPYEEGFDDAFKFRYEARDLDSSVGIKSNYWIRPEYDPKQTEKAIRCQRNVEVFKLLDLYENSHTAEIAEIARKFHISNGAYLESLLNSFPQLGSLEELYQIAFGAYFAVDDFERRPLSKLIKDIVEQLSFTLPVMPK